MPEGVQAAFWNAQLFKNPVERMAHIVLLKWRAIATLKNSSASSAPKMIFEHLCDFRANVYHPHTAASFRVPFRSLVNAPTYVYLTSEDVQVLYMKPKSLATTGTDLRQ